jgi:UDP-GlcNAc:undecaprenyl-phosphate GlcNAc-1-phosphate transferase
VSGLDFGLFFPAVLPALVAAGVVLAAVPLVQRLAMRLGAVDYPEERRIHRTPVARLGGLAMLIGFAAGAAVARPPALDVGGLMLSAALVTVVLAYDDLRGMSPGLKLIAQIGVALVAAVAFQIKIDSVSLHALGWLAVPLTVFWLVAMQNTVNFLDGVDGLAAGVVAIVAAALLLAAINVQKPDQVALAGALVGVCLAFLVFNRYPARIFMGDSGSHFLGFTLGALSIMAVAKAPVALGLLVPALALALPIIDTGWAILRRRRLGVSVARPDAAHLHHRLLGLGLSQPEAATVFYLATAVLSAISLTVNSHHKKILAIVGLAAVIGLTTMAIEHASRRRE